MITIEDRRAVREFPLFDLSKHALSPCIRIYAIMRVSGHLFLLFQCFSMNVTISRKHSESLWRKTAERDFNAGETKALAAEVKEESQPTLTKHPLAHVRQQTVRRDSHVHADVQPADLVQRRAFHFSDACRLRAGALIKRTAGSLIAHY